MRFYLNKNVYEVAVERFRFIFDEFEEVIVWVSGGKDSTVIFDMALKTAKELDRLPLRVAFIDQESEWMSTIDQIHTMMYHKDVIPQWYQFPFKTNNSTSFTNEWLYAWDEKEKDKWAREKDPISIKENNYGTDRFYDLFGAILDTDFHNTEVGSISGVRTEESPKRFAGLTAAPSYKWITWGRKYNNLNHVTFYPLYDWSYTDIWKYIYDNKLRYNKIYDLQFKYGMSINNMRVSSLHHETAIHSLFYMQEAEPKTYNKLIGRLTGINTANILGEDDYYINELPFMFTDWVEYRDYLLEHIIDKQHHKQFKSWFTRIENEFKDIEHLLPKNFKKKIPKYDSIVRGEINALLCNDFEGTKLKNLHHRNSCPETRMIRKRRENEQKTNTVNK